MSTGKVKWFDGKKGCGFIIPMDREVDVFVHYTAIKSDSGQKILREGMEVQFDLTEGRKGLQALNVVVLP